MIPYMKERAWNAKLGRMVTREEWEREHKPTCTVYPCSHWPEIHWHLSSANSTPIPVKPIVKR